MREVLANAKKRELEALRLTDKGPTCSDVGQQAGEAGLALTFLAPRWATRSTSSPA